MVAEKFNIMVNITGKYICESVHFYSCPQAKLSCKFLSLPPRQKEITHSFRTVFSGDLFFSQQKGEGERITEEKIPKLNLQGY